MLSIFKRKNSKIKNSHSIDEEAANFIMASRDKGIGIKSSLIEYTALTRGLEVERISNTNLTVKMKNGQIIAFRNMNGVLSSQIGKNLCDRKQDSRYLLKNAGLNI